MHLESSELARLRATRTAWVLLFTPTVAEPCFTASMAYSTWARWSTGIGLVRIFRKTKPHRTVAKS